MVSYSILVRACWARLKYDRVLAVGALSYGFLRLSKTESPVFLVLQLIAYV